MQLLPTASSARRLNIGGKKLNTRNWYCRDIFDWFYISSLRCANISPSSTYKCGYVHSHAPLDGIKKNKRWINNDIDSRVSLVGSINRATTRREDGSRVNGKLATDRCFQSLNKLHRPTMRLSVPSSRGYLGWHLPPRALWEVAPPPSATNAHQF